MGLAIVKHICANHGGEVSLWSAEGHGSTFTVRLPLAPSPTPDEPLVLPATAVPAAPLSPSSSNSTSQGDQPS